MTLSCPICNLHRDIDQQKKYEIYRDDLWVLRHHPTPAPLLGWLLLDSLRHCSGPIDFSANESSNWGIAVRDACTLIKQLTQCDRIYTIAFGEGAQHLHLHLIPRLISNPATKAWSIADHYRSVDSGKISPSPARSTQRVCCQGSRNQGDNFPLFMIFFM